MNKFKRYLVQCYCFCVFGNGISQEHISPSFLGWSHVLNMNDFDKFWKYLVFLNGMHSCNLVNLWFLVCTWIVVMKGYLGSEGGSGRERGVSQILQFSWSFNRVYSLCIKHVYIEKYHWCMNLSGYVYRKQARLALRDGVLPGLNVNKWTFIWIMMNVNSLLTALNDMTLMKNYPGHINMLKSSFLNVYLYH